MAIDPKLLHILRCPITKQKLTVAKDKELALINTQVESNQLQHNDSSLVTEQLSAALITENRQVIYKITQGVPVMLEDQSIPSQQIENWA